MKNGFVLRALRHLVWQVLSSFRLLRHSGIAKVNTSSQIFFKTLASVHAIEKGITMPLMRQNFGKIHLEVIRDYLKNHRGNEWLVLYCQNTLDAYAAIHNTDKLQKAETNQRLVTSNAPEFGFARFAQQRQSVRNFNAKPVDLSLVQKSISVAQTAPSSCNRQGVGIHILTRADNPDVFSQVLEIQGGNRGFSHCINHLAIITFDLNAVNGLFETHMPFVDGGYFAMAFTYALLEHSIFSVPLNCNFSHSKAKKLRSLLTLPQSNVFVVMKAFGHADPEVMVPQSRRRDLTSPS